MQTSAIKASYARELKETILVRRYTGAGANRPMFQVSVRGKAWGYDAKELVGTVQQGDQRVLVLVDDLIAHQFALPVTDKDKVVVKGRELAIMSPGERKAPDGTIIAYELQVRG